MHPSRQAFVEDADSDSGQIDYADLPTDYNYDLQPAAGAEPSRSAANVLTEFARKRKAAALAVPTDDLRVRAELRAKGEPITLFGERREDRRDRLREILMKEQERGGSEDVVMNDVKEPAEGDEQEEFYTEGTQALLEARQKLARYSIPRAKERIEHQRIESRITVETHVAHRKIIKEKLSEFELFGSQVASERPVSIVRFAPNGEKLAVGDWDGTVKIIDVPNLETQKVLRGHKGVVGGISWFPGATLPSSNVRPGGVNLATAGGDGVIQLWSLTQDEPITSLTGHNGRVCRTEFHPSGKYLASASYDTSWRLWDVATGKELLLQEGHSKEVYAISFNDDGSLVCSAGLDSIGRVWDLRTGRTAMLLEGHIAPIYALDWGPDAVRILSGSSDGFAKCWDMRSLKQTANIGAHIGGVSDLRWFKGTDGPLSGKKPPTKAIRNPGGKGGFTVEVQPKKSGTFVVSAGFDKAVNIWSADDWTLCKSMTGHDNTVLSTDVTADAKWIASCGRDRTVKLWSTSDMNGI